MRVEVTEKQEKFAQAYLELEGNAAEAYRRSYNAGKMKEASIWREAHAVLHNPKVASRLTQLRQRAMERHDITVDTLTEMLIEDRKLARDKEAPAAAVSAVMGMAKLHGLIIDKAKTDVTTDGKPIVPVINVIRGTQS